jgi:hypothetical protein
MTLRRLFHLLAAYLVVLHAMGMAAMAAPSASAADPFAVICTLDGQTSNPDDPSHPGAHHVPCALCGLGASAVASPPEAPVLADIPPAQVDGPHPEARVIVVSRTCVVPQPRGPPAAA